MTPVAKHVDFTIFIFEKRKNVSSLFCKFVFLMELHLSIVGERFNVANHSKSFAHCSDFGDNIMNCWDWVPHGNIDVTEIKDHSDKGDPWHDINETSMKSFFKTLGNWKCKMSFILFIPQCANAPKFLCNINAECYTSHTVAVSFIVRVWLSFNRTDHFRLKLKHRHSFISNYSPLRNTPIKEPSQD